MLACLERRAAKKAAADAAAAMRAEQAAGGERSSGGGGGGASSKRAYNHSITLLVPPFDPDLIKFPSYVERETNRYTMLVRPMLCMDMTCSHSMSVGELASCCWCELK